MKKEDKDLELQLLREENERLKNQEEARINDRSNVYFNELRSIQKVGEKTKGNIQYKDIHHPTVTLWRKDGKRIGPLHPANAETTFQRFYDVGVLLSTKKPTDEEIAKYKLTEEWKKIEAAEIKKRKLREKSKKPDQIQKLAELLQSQGVPKAAISNIKKPEEVGV